MSLEDTLANLSLYDAKKYFRKAQNVVYNYTDMESKVREATNNEPWGASSTLMEQIAQGTYNIREREEILGMIFRRFTEKSGSEWRQIYKALQLLEYLIKHGSERFIDDTRNSISIVKLLESFHYIDSQGRDQGVNVRNRAAALTALLADDSSIRAERKKARETKKKYKGVAGGVTSMNTGLEANTRAGFNSSRSHGISVSADFDSDESDDGVYKSSNRSGGFRDNVDDRENSNEGTTTTANVMQSNSDEDFFSSLKKPEVSQNNHANLDEDDEDDDEFTDFQTAVPVNSTLNNTATSHGNTTNNNEFDLLGMNMNSTATYPKPSTNDVIPAIAQDKKKDDPFSSLFSSAKTLPAEPKKAQIQQNQPISSQTDKADEDEFNDLMSSGPTTTSAQTSAPTPSQSNAGEIDLLSF